MNLYSNKQKWKIALLITAIILVALSLFYTNQIVGSVGLRERERVSQWSDVIRKKAELINLTNQTFDELRVRERQKVELWAKATRELNKITSLETDLTFAVDIIKENTDIPVVLLDRKNRLLSYKNVSFTPEDLGRDFPDIDQKELKVKFADSLSKLALHWARTHEPISIEVVPNVSQKIYYFDSDRLIELERLRDSLLLSFNRELIDNTTMVPVIFYDLENDVLIETNIDSLKKYRDTSIPHLSKLLNSMVDSLDIRLASNQLGRLYYDDSKELKQLRFYPYVQFGLIGLFIFIGYIIFSTFRKAEQNQVWAGMAKETAHQLGTPISSLMAWIQLLEAKGHPTDEILEMNKDVERLTTIADRFEKIGSGGRLEPNDLKDTVSKSYNYLKYRISKKVDFTLEMPEHEVVVMHNPSLIEWVIENICKNAVDAMDGKGVLRIVVLESGRNVHIDISDNGKGIPSNKIKTIFNPGYTTKQRGWGLGLSLVKRIVETYHKGRVFVLNSEINKGTTFRVTLRKP
jgi:signal transduction histidine kinase